MKSLHFLFVAFLFAFLSPGEVAGQNKGPIVLEGQKARLEIQTEGSAITHFSLKKNGINPLSWTLEPKDMPKPNENAPVFRGHFLCMGRWGAASEAEQRAGVPHNGEVNTLTWKVLEPVQTKGETLAAKMECYGPKDQLKVTREVSMSVNGSSFLMSETVENTAPTDKIYNFTQHPTIGAPFLNPTTLIDCNAGLGFDQRVDYQSLEKSAFRFPEGHLVDGYADLRRVNEERGYVTSHIFPDTTATGWVTATNPEMKLVLGYVFKTKEYPWLNLWHWKKDRKPHAHGLEFGTTGLGQPYKFLIENCISFYGRKSLDWIEAGQKINKKYICFIAEVPENFEGVGRLYHAPGKIVLVENKAQKPRQIEISVVEGF